MRIPDRLIAKILPHRLHCHQLRAPLPDILDQHKPQRYPSHQLHTHRTAREHSVSECEVSERARARRARARERERERERERGNLAHPALVQEALHEKRLILLNPGSVLRGQPSANVQASSRQISQRCRSRLGAIPVPHHVELDEMHLRTLTFTNSLGIEPEEVSSL